MIISSLIDAVARAAEALGTEAVRSGKRENVYPAVLAAVYRHLLGEDLSQGLGLPALALEPRFLDGVIVDGPALGALHEAMLARAPRIEGDTFVLGPAPRGRRATGSFYTPAPLVSWLLDAVLEPVRHGLRVCDPSCGAGAFLLAAAERLARGGASRVEIVSTCLYGVDLDPLAVLLCRGALWLWAGAPRPVPPGLLAHVRHGDALVGVDASHLAAGLPDEVAGAPWFVGRGPEASAWRRRNRMERSEADVRLTPGAADAWCAAFLWPADAEGPPPTTAELARGATGSVDTTSPLSRGAVVRSAAAVSSPSPGGGGEDVHVGIQAGITPAEMHGRSPDVARITTSLAPVHWPLVFPEVFADGGFDVVLGNPPFLNQLESDTVAARPMAALHRAIFVDRVGPYTDRASLLLLRGARLLRAGGRLGMVQPQSVLAAKDSRAIRDELAATTPPTHVWWAGEQVFPGASVLVTALGLRRGPPSPEVIRAAGASFAPLPSHPVDTLVGAETWTPLVAEALGAPRVVLPSPHTLAEIASATADFRDEYYGLVPWVVDRAEADEVRFPRLVLTGHIDPARTFWGERPVRFGRQSWVHPRVDRQGLAGRLAEWARARCVPKLLLATQTRVLEAVADPHGTWLTTTPTVTVLPAEGELWRVAAVLLAPPVSAWALANFGAAALAAGAIKLSARQVERVPLPSHRDAWDAAAVAIARAHTGDRNALLEAGRLMTEAYGASPAIFTWWRDRLPGK